jgi:hypothetical protein
MQGWMTAAGASVVLEPPPLGLAGGRGERNWCRRCLPERFAHPLAGPRGVLVPVQLADELAAVLMPEVQRNVASVELQHVPGVPTEVVPGGGVEIDVAQTWGAAHTFQ